VAHRHVTRNIAWLWLATTLLSSECDAILVKINGVPDFAGLVALRRQLKTLQATAKMDFKAIAEVGTKLQEAGLAGLPLVDQHTALVPKVTEQCRELAMAGDYGGLKFMAAKLVLLEGAAKRPSREPAVLDQPYVRPPLILLSILAAPFVGGSAVRGVCYLHDYIGSLL
jgi:hypothetical protein